MIEVVIFGLVCFAIGLVTGVALIVTIMVKAMKMLGKRGPNPPVKHF